MRTNWPELATNLESINHENDSQKGGQHFAEKAVEIILGKEWLIDTVEYAISNEPGSELAMNCLKHIRSASACKYAYEIYKSSSGDRANMAVWLIKHIANKVSFDWIDEFLDDPNVVGFGLGVLDQLLWTKEINYDNNVEQLFQKASKNSNGGLDELINFIRDYLK